MTGVWDRVAPNDWSDILRVVTVGTLAYVLLVVVLRTSGKRTLATLNAFDLVVTVSLGSTLATILLNSSVSLAEGAVALGLLVGLQFVVAWLSVRVAPIRRLVKAEPQLLLRDGTMVEDRLRSERMAPEEVRQAVRSAGYGALELVHSVVLETDGTLSVVPRANAGSGSALVDVQPPG